ncbi:MAG: hypothetical protein QOH09_4844, partial [Pseudonocardiales bacterium]|nr:hypothetical protein [Pseudonocardiales bacterium]
DPHAGGPLEGYVYAGCGVVGIRSGR